MKNSLVIFFFVLFFGIVAIDAKKVCNCRIPIQSKIVNGNETRIPWLITVKNSYKKTICTGILMNKYHVLTAASCLEEDEASYYLLKVITGSLASHEKKDEYDVKNIKKINEFSVYKIQEGGDLAVLVLNRPVELINGKTELACLDFEYKKEPANDFEAILANVTANETLFSTDFDIKEPETQNNVIRSLEFKIKEDIESIESPNLIAAQSVDKEKSICGGNIGAPLHRTVSGVTKVIGIASYADGGHNADGSVRYCTENVYFTRLQDYRAWFDELQVRYC